MFRAICSFTILFIVALPLRAADEVKPNTLTPKEVEEGWISLFDGETTFGWTFGNSDGGTTEAAVADGQLILSNEKHKTGCNLTTKFEYFEIQFEYRTEGSEEAWFTLGNADRESHGYRLDRAKGTRWGRASIRFARDGIADRFDFPKGKPRQGKHEMPGPRGPWELRFKFLDNGKDNKLFLRNMKLHPLEAKPLFNGKDLTGWKKFDADPKKAKSEFSVAKEGWIRLKDGPGDLQTEKEWGDFILQIECFSNGDKLNSGVFFRCRPNEYQNGYEAQSHNGFTEKAEKEYAIEEYDPETHKLKDTKKVKYQAMDYGTGGIYRRMPARRSV